MDDKRVHCSPFGLLVFENTDEWYAGEGLKSVRLQSFRAIQSNYAVLSYRQDSEMYHIPPSLRLEETIQSFPFHPSLSLDVAMEMSSSTEQTPSEMLPSRLKSKGVLTFQRKKAHRQRDWRHFASINCRLGWRMLPKIHAFPFNYSDSE